MSVISPVQSHDHEGSPKLIVAVRFLRHSALTVFPQHRQNTSDQKEKI